MAKQRPTIQSARALAEADLARSGLTWADAERLGCEAWEAERTQRELGHAWPALYLPYHDLQHRLRKGVYRVRLLGTQPGPFGTVVCPPMRYLQPKDSVPAAYFAPATNWQAMASDPSQTLWLTEGEKKAAKACRAGLYCVGLGGVWSFMSKRLGTDLLPELREIPLAQRQVAICFDSDVSVKPDVAKAVLRLTDVLTREGAYVRSVLLPDGPGGAKVGLDDYLLTHKLKDLVDLFDEAHAADLGRALWELNDRYVVIHHPTMVLDVGAADDRGQPQLKPLTAVQFTQVVAADKIVQETLHDGKTRKVKVAPEWLMWPARQCYEALTYAPGEGRVLNGVTTPRLNGWRGLAVEPKRGDVRPWTELLDHLFQGAEPEARVWFERWCGWPLKHLGAKLLSAVGVWSSLTGQGKTLIGDTLGRVYGANFISISQRALEEPHNPWALNRQLVLVDDISSHDTRTTADLLKKLITQNDTNVNIKYISQFTVPDHINYYFTSNQGDAFYVDEHDRRFFIHEVRVGKLPKAFYDRYFAWLDGPGPAALLDHLQNQLDYGDFDAKQPPPYTQAKREMVEGVRSELDAWVAGLKDLDRLGRDLWTASELCDRFNASAVGRRVAPNAFGRRLRRRYQRVQVDTGKMEQYYVLGNEAKWLKATNKERAAHVQSAKRF
jgi:hypothetical protein